MLHIKNLLKKHLESALGKHKWGPFEQRWEGVENFWSWNGTKQIGTYQNGMNVAWGTAEFFVSFRFYQIRALICFIPFCSNPFRFAWFRFDKYHLCSVSFQTISIHSVLLRSVFIDFFSLAALFNSVPLLPVPFVF